MSAALARPLPVPAFFDPRHAGQYGYAPDSGRLFSEAMRWRREHRVAPSAADERRVHLLLVDMQKDFCLPEGSLYVGGRSGRGAVEDSRRTAEFVYRNLATLTSITTTLDSHLAFQVFFPSFWVDREGQPLQPHRELTVGQIDRGEVSPHPALASWLCRGDEAWLRRQVRHYCAELERTGRYRLYLWPFHCLLGSEGHALVGVIQEARLFHSFVRQAQSTVEPKGSLALTEHYSALRPEVLLAHDGTPLAQPSPAFLETLLGADALLVAGQAASHCVRSTLEDLLAAVLSRDAALARKVYVLVDCMSAVAVPDGAGGFLADFTPHAEAALARFAAAGMHLVRSTDPVAEWPGFASP